MVDDTIGKVTDGGGYAARNIKKGEAATVDDELALQKELDMFLKAYEFAANTRDFSVVSPFIANDATFWFTNGQYEGKESVRRAFEDTWKTIQNETYTISEAHWVAINYWVSVCTYNFESDGIVDGRQQVYRGKGTNVLVRTGGSWQIVHEHLSK